MPDIDLPKQLPIFPLTGTLLLPGMMLPLNIFEERYQNMVKDAMASDKMIGMIQPMVPQRDNHPLPGAELEKPRLYPMGCVGVIDNFRETKKGRFKIILRGLSRFQILEELPLSEGGYRRVVPDYSPFVDDPAEIQQQLDGTELLRTFVEFATGNGRTTDIGVMEGLPGPMLVNGLAMMVPFAPVEKQALLEADGLGSRMEILFSLFKMGALMEGPQRNIPPEVN